MRRPHLRDLSEPVLATGYTLHELTDPEHTVELADLLSKAFDEDWDEERVHKELLHTPDVHAVYGVSYQNKLVATASSQIRAHRSTTSGYVHWVASHPDYRGRNLALALVTRLLQDFVERHYRDAFLETQAFRLAAIKTYLRLGFIPVYHFEGKDFQDLWSEIFQNLLKLNGSAKV